MGSPAHRAHLLFWRMLWGQAGWAVLLHPIWPQGGMRHAEHTWLLDQIPKWLPFLKLKFLLRLFFSSLNKHMLPDSELFSF